MTAKFKPCKFIKDKKKNEFLNNLVRYGTIEKAAEATGIVRQTHYDWKKASDEYCMKYDEARAMLADNLEDAAYKRAVDGVERHVYWRGQIIDTYREYSDALLTTLLKANMPEKYKDRVAAETTSEQGASVLGWEGVDDGE